MKLEAGWTKLTRATHFPVGLVRHTSRSQEKRSWYQQLCILHSHSEVHLPGRTIPSPPCRHACHALLSSLSLPTYPARRSRIRRASWACTRLLSISPGSCTQQKNCNRKTDGMRVHTVPSLFRCRLGKEVTPLEMRTVVGRRHSQRLRPPRNRAETNGRMYALKWLSFGAVVFQQRLESCDEKEESSFCETFSSQDHDVDHKKHDRHHHYHRCHQRHARMNPSDLKRLHERLLGDLVEHRPLHRHLRLQHLLRKHKPHAPQ